MNNFDLDLEETTPEFKEDHNIEKHLKTLGIKPKAEYKQVDVNKVVAGEQHRTNREGTIDGLTESIEKLGVMQPLIVTPMEDLKDHYILIDGLRRLYSATKLGFEKVPVLVFEYTDKRAIKEDSVILGSLLSKTRKLNNAGLWEAIQFYLKEGIDDFTTLDNLFDLAGGDVIKIIDVMESEYQEPKDYFIIEHKDINYAKRELDKLRRLAVSKDGDDEDSRLKTDAETKEDLGYSDDEDLSFEGSQKVSILKLEYIDDDSQERELFKAIKLADILNGQVELDDLQHTGTYFISEAKITPDELEELSEQGLIEEAKGADEEDNDELDENDELDGLDVLDELEDLAKEELEDEDDTDDDNTDTPVDIEDDKVDKEDVEPEEELDFDKASGTIGSLFGPDSK